MSEYYKARVGSFIPTDNPLYSLGAEEYIAVENAHTLSTGFTKTTNSDFLYSNGSIITHPYVDGWNQIQTSKLYSPSNNIVLKGSRPGFGKFFETATVYQTYMAYNITIKRKGWEELTVKTTAVGFTETTNTYYPSDFVDGVIPSRLIIECQAGGGGGSSAFNAVVYGLDGGGGGSGAYGVYILNLSSFPYWKLEVTERAKGGEGNWAPGAKGATITGYYTNSDSTSKSVPQFIVNGGEGSFAKDNVAHGGAGGTIYINTAAFNTHSFFILEGIDGKQGGYNGGGGKGEDMGAHTQYATKYTENSIAWGNSKRTIMRQSGGDAGDNLSGGGAASVLGNGGAGGNAGHPMGYDGGIGGGGGGGRYNLFGTPSGGNGGPSQIIIYY